VTIHGNLKSPRVKEDIREQPRDKPNSIEYRLFEDNEKLKKAEEGKQILDRYTTLKVVLGVLLVQT
jgi:hypothetical protein